MKLVLSLIILVVSNASPLPAQKDVVPPFNKTYAGFHLDLFKYLNLNSPDNAVVKSVLGIGIKIEQPLSDIVSITSGFSLSKYQYTLFDDVDAAYIPLFTKQIATVSYYSIPFGINFKLYDNEGYFIYGGLKVNPCQRYRAKAELVRFRAPDLKFIDHINVKQFIQYGLGFSCYKTFKKMNIGVIALYNYFEPYAPNAFIFNRIQNIHRLENVELSFEVNRKFTLFKK